MPEQKRVTKSKSETKRVAEQESAETTKIAEKEKSEQELLDETDELLAAIDEALGEELLANAAAFVRDYQQKGGE